MRTATWNQVFIVIVSRQRQCKFIGDTSNWLERSTRDVPSRFYAAYLSHESKFFTRALFQINFQILHRSEKKAKKLKKLLLYKLHTSNCHNQFKKKIFIFKFYFLQTYMCYVISIIVLSFIVFK